MNPFPYTLWIIVQFVIGYHLILPLFQYFFYKIIPHRKPQSKIFIKEPDYAIIVTAYEQVDTVPAAVASLLKMNYSNYLIYVVADKCDVSALKFSDERVIILRPEETLGSNTRSHFYAIQRFRRDHQYLTIIDSDNLVDPDYLNQLNLYFNKGYEAVQGVRKAKNLDTVYACLDAVQDMYYNFYDREVLFHLGSSATLAGSGMAFTTSLYRQRLEHMDITGAGFDKVLQYEILNGKHRIAFAHDAIVYDEKTSRSDQLVKQRARWFNTWFRYAGLGFKLLLGGIFRLNWNQFAFGVMFLRPPLFLVFLSSVLLLAANFFISSLLVYCWIGGFIGFFGALIIALLHWKADMRIYKSLAGVPLFIFHQVRSLLKVRKANQYSVATRHYHNSTIDELQS